MALQLLCREIIALHVRGVLNRLHQREWRVQYQRTLTRCVRILQRVTQGDRTCVTTETTANTNHAEIDTYHKQRDLQRIINSRFHLRQTPALTRQPEESHQYSNQKQHRVPVFQHTVRNDGAHIIVIRHFREERTGRSPVHKTDIHAVRIIENNTNRVRDPEQP